MSNLTKFLLLPEALNWRVALFIQIIIVLHIAALIYWAIIAIRSKPKLSKMPPIDPHEKKEEEKVPLHESKPKNE